MDEILSAEKRHVPEIQIEQEVDYSCLSLVDL